MQKDMQLVRWFCQTSTLMGNSGPTSWANDPSMYPANTFREDKLPSAVQRAMREKREAARKEALKVVKATAAKKGRQLGEA